MEPLALASASPRRLEILTSLGFPVRSFPANLDESIFDHLPVDQRTMELALSKAGAVLASLPADYRWVLGADTLVELPPPAGILGKPENLEAARAMLAALAGRSHLVHSGLCLLDRHTGRHWQAASVTEVEFAAMDRAELDWYLSRDEWRGAAGGYRIQESAALFIRSVRGSYSGVMGLPIHEFYGILKAGGYVLARAEA